MRISKASARIATGGVLATLVGGLCVAFGLGFSPRSGELLAPALAFDGTATPNTALLTPSVPTPENSEKAKELSALQYAAEQGQIGAQWKIGRMLADGDGVAQNDLRAFEYFSQIANSHAGEPPGTPQARIVANAFVALGRYYLKGIPNSAVEPDANRARQMFLYAASYFGDADAQYELGRLYLGGTPSDMHEAARWFLLAANKGHCRAEIALGDILFRGQQVPRQAARGLMWLTLGRDCAGADQPWIKPLYDDAFRTASDDERATALLFLRNWMNGRRD
jgi:exopolysaccharide production negative regulator